MTDNEKDFVLAQTREIKLKIVKDLVIAGFFQSYFELSKILLDAPITNGGIESETLDAIFNEYKEQGVDAAFLRSEARVIEAGFALNK